MSKEKRCRKACERHDASWHTELAGHALNSLDARLLLTRSILEMLSGVRATRGRQVFFLARTLTCNPDL
jgi:hypothetical protein